MCTVTYLPLATNGFILTSNRDEQLVREVALPPRKYQINKIPVFYPKDPRAGGTWIVTSGNDYTLCLLNGAVEKHISGEHYRLSRGVVVLDFFNYRDVHDFVSRYDFNNIEPFTLIIINSKATAKIHVLKWDGEKVILNEEDERQPQIWSSVTLYTNETIVARREWFNNWLKSTEQFTQSGITAFHRFGGTGDRYTDLLMNRENKVLTVSITSVLKTREETKLQYQDIVNNKEYLIRII